MFEPSCGPMFKPSFLGTPLVPPLKVRSPSSGARAKDATVCIWIWDLRPCYQGAMYLDMYLDMGCICIRMLCIWRVDLTRTDRAALRMLCVSPRSQDHLGQANGQCRWKRGLHSMKSGNMDSLRGSSVSIRTVQRRLAWPLRKDDTRNS